MNKSTLSNELAARAEIPKVHAARYVDLVLQIISGSLIDGEKVTLSDFGTFNISHRKAFTGHNPKNGEEIAVPARRIPVFRSGKGLKNRLNS